MFKKIIQYVCCIICALFLSACDMDQTSLRQVNSNILDSFDFYAYSEDSGLYSINAKGAQYVVFNRMPIDPDRVTLTNEDGVYTIHFERVSNINEGTYVYQFQMDPACSSKDCYLICMEQDTEVPFESIILTQ